MYLGHFRCHKWHFRIKFVQKGGFRRFWPTAQCRHFSFHVTRFVLTISYCQFHLESVIESADRHSNRGDPRQGRTMTWQMLLWSVFIVIMQVNFFIWSLFWSVEAKLQQLFTDHRLAVMLWCSIHVKTIFCAKLRKTARSYVQHGYWRVLLITASGRGYLPLRPSLQLPCSIIIVVECWRHASNNNKRPAWDHLMNAILSIFQTSRLCWFVIKT